MFNQSHNSKDFAIIVLCNKEQTKALDLCEIFFVCTDVFIYLIAAGNKRCKHRRKQKLSCINPKPSFVLYCTK